MATLKVKIDPKSLECSLCLGTVSDPRILPCGHTFCGPKSPDKCLQKLDPRNAAKIKCPNCQTDHQVRVADVPPNINCREMLESLNSSKQGKRLCRKHNKKIVMRCVTDGEEVCVSCIAGDHRGHDLEEVHKQEHKRLSEFWTQESAKLEDKLLESKRREESFEREAENLQNQRLQEYSLGNRLGDLITRRDAITRKLASNDFNPDDQDVTALREYMDQLDATAECQQEASGDVRERSRHLIQLVDSRAPTYCQNINKNTVPATTRPPPNPEMIPALSKRPTGVDKMPTANEGGSTSRQDVSRRTLPEENVNCTTNILALGTEGKHYILELKANRWEEWKGKRDDFDFGFGAICHQEKVYIIGGYRGESSPKVDIFHIRENKWAEGPELNIPRRWAAACFVDSQRSIYICGGRKSCDTGDVLNSVEKLKLDENGSPVGKWREVTPMKEKRDGCAAVAVGSRLFVTGGKNQNDDSLSSVQIFKTDTKKWKYGPRMQECRDMHVVEHYNGCIYAMGGTNGANNLESCEKLDLHNWTWTSIESMRVPRACLGSIVANDKIYVVGGWGQGAGEDVKSVEIYDLVANTWSRGVQLPEDTCRTKCLCW